MIFAEQKNGNEPGAPLKLAFDWKMHVEKRFNYDQQHTINLTKKY
jgi:hypothetical protein